jgi:hypothetical protein
MSTRKHLAILSSLSSVLIWFCAFPALGQSTKVWTNSIGGLWHAPGNRSLSAAPNITNSIVAITNFNSKTIIADASTPATNLYLRNLTLGALQNRQNTLVLTNLVTPLEVTRGFAMNSGAALQIHNSQVIVDGALNGQMTVTSASAALHSGAQRCGSLDQRCFVEDREWYRYRRVQHHQRCPSHR